MNWLSLLQGKAPATPLPKGEARVNIVFAENRRRAKETARRSLVKEEQYARKRNRWATMSPEKKAEILAKQKAYRARPEYKEQRKKYDANYHISHYEERNEARRKWAAENRDKQKEARARYEAKNPGKSAKWKRDRLARMKVENPEAYRAFREKDNARKRLENALKKAGKV